MIHGVGAYTELVPPLTSLALLLLLFAGLPFLGARTHRRALTLDRSSIYLSLTFTQWLVAGLLGVVLMVEGQTMASIGLRPASAFATIFWTMLVAAGGCGVVTLALGMRRILRLRESATIRHMIPRTWRERLLMAFVVSPTAGFVEEILYRGFGITRLERILGDPWLAALLVAGAFSLGHLYQGTLGALRAGVLGFLLALPFLYTGSLWPCIVAHALLDMSFGLFLYRAFLDPEVDERERISRSISRA